MASHRLVVAGRAVTAIECLFVCARCDGGGGDGVHV